MREQSLTNTRCRPSFGLPTPNPFHREAHPSAIAAWRRSSQTIGCRKAHKVRLTRWVRDLPRIRRGGIHPNALWALEGYLEKNWCGRSSRPVRAWH